MARKTKKTTAASTAHNIRRGRRFHAGVEGQISVIKRKYGLRRRNRGSAGFERWVGWGIIANNLTMMGRGHST